MIAPQNQYMVRIMITQNIKILKNRIRCTLIPSLFSALLRGKKLDLLFETAIKKTPAR